MDTEVISTDVDDGVAVVEWHELQPESVAVGRRVLDLLGRDDVEAYVSIDRTDQYLDADVQYAIERLAGKAVELGVERIAIVADGIKPLAAKSALEGTDMTVFTSEDPDEAVEWAREGG